MIISGKAADKLVFAVLYVVFIVLIIWGGVKVINYSLDSRFYKDFLLPWEVSMKSYSVKERVLPYFSGGNHREYMDNLVKLMRACDISPPLPDTGYAYIYLMEKIGRERARIFLLCLNNRIIIYGMHKDTFERVDTFIDGKMNSKRGSFTGHHVKNGKTYTGLWRL